MQVIGDSYRGLIDKHITPRPARVPFFSSVKAKVLHEADAFGPQYWQDNLESPVLFHSAVTRLLAESHQSFIHLEVGPHSALAGPLRQIYRETGSTIQYASVLARGKNDTESFLESVGQLYCGGVKIYFPASKGTKVLTNLPTYPWHYEGSYWAETRVMSNWRFRKHLPHDLLGLRTLESSDADPTWRNNLRIIDVPWLRDHCVGNDIVFPAAAYMAMAGESVFQITGSRDYTLREVDFSTAMVLRENKPTEIMTTLRKKRLTSTLDSNWYEFSIVSHDGTTWNKHCSGLIINGRASAAPAPKVNVYIKGVSPKRWYQTMSRVGLNYGPRFTGLEDITTSTAEKKAAMSVMDRQTDTESSYTLHPTTLDLILQSWTVASVKGEYRLFTKLFLPTFIEEFYIRPATSKKIKVNTVAIGPSGTARGESYGVADGEVVYFLKGFKGTPLNHSDMEKPAEQTALHLQWEPDFTFADATELMRPSYDSTSQLRMLERMFVLCAIEAKKKLVGVKSSQPHFEKYRFWIHNQVERFLQPNYPLVEDSANLVNLDEGSRRQMILECLEQSQTTTAWPVATAIWRAYDRLIDVFEGQVEYLTLLFQDGLMPKFYDWSNNLSDVGDLFQLLAHTKPQLRVLEIGAGTGGATAKTLEKLKSDFGERLYLKYTISDVSSGFFVQCKERFKEHEAIEYKVLDVSKDPIGQGFNAGEYDLIIASNVSDKPMPKFPCHLTTSGTARHPFPHRDAEALSHIAQI
jgi:acyl transferase domain-containing protein